MEVDVTDRGQVDAMAAKAMDTFGHIDILVNNAGASSRMMPFIDSTKKDWQFDIGINLFGQMNVAQAVLPHMLAAIRAELSTPPGDKVSPPFPCTALRRPVL